MTCARRHICTLEDHKLSHTHNYKRPACVPMFLFWWQGLDEQNKNKENMIALYVLLDTLPPSDAQLYSVDGSSRKAERELYYSVSWNAPFMRADQHESKKSPLYMGSLEQRTDTYPTNTDVWFNRYYVRTLDSRALDYTQRMLAPTCPNPPAPLA